MSDNGSFDLTDQEASVVIAALVIIALCALGLFILILLDDTLFRIDDDDDDYDEELYKNPWKLYQFPVQHQQQQSQQHQQQQQQVATERPPPPQSQQQVPPPKDDGSWEDYETLLLTAPPATVNAKIRQQQVKSPQLAPPRLALKNQGVQTLPVMREIQTQTDAPGLLPLSQPQPNEQRIVEAAPSASMVNTDIVVYNAPEEKGEIRSSPVSFKTEPSVVRDFKKQVSFSDDDMDSDEEEESEVEIAEIASFRPGQSMLSLPEEVKKFEGKAAAKRPPPKKVYDNSSIDSPAGFPDSPSTINKAYPLKTFIPRYSHKAERRRFIILNGLMLIISACILTVVLLRLYL